MKLNRDVRIDTTPVIFQMYESINYLPAEFVKKHLGMPILPEWFEMSGCKWVLKQNNTIFAHFEKE